ncbi:MAG: hypothetical protein AAFU60_07185 [Bacteroidota bacterium]
MIPKSSFRYLFVAAFFAWTIAVLVLNGWLAPHLVGEWDLVAQARSESWLQAIPLVWLVHGMDYLFDGAMQGWRLPGALWMILVASLAWIEARKILGEALANLSVIVLSASWMLMWSTKFAGSDVYLFGFQWLASLYLLQYLKGQQRNAGLFFGLATVLGTLVAPSSMWVSMLLLVAGLRFLHPHGKTLDALYWYIWLPLGAAGMIFWQGWSWQPAYSLFSSLGLPAFWGWQLLGFWPLIGFLLAGLYQMIRRVEKGEELARILLVLLVVGWLTGSHLSLWAMAVLIAQQILNYLHPNYPYQAIVKSGSIFAMLLLFAAGAWAMMSGYYYLGAPGFRGAMSTSVVYWIPGFFAIVGLYGQNLRTTVWASLLGAWLFFVVGIIQIGSLANPLRDWAVQLPGTEEAVEQYLLVDPNEVAWMQASLRASATEHGWQVITEEPVSSTEPVYKVEIASAWQNDLDWQEEVIAWDAEGRRLVWLKIEQMP